MSRTERKYYEDGIVLIFLDIDGVLNSWCSYIIANQNHQPETIRDLCPDAIRNLNMVLDAHENAYIVISSTWRYGSHWTILDMLLTYKGLHPHSIIGETPINRFKDYEGNELYKERGYEIERWIKHYQEDLPTGEHVEKFLNKYLTSKHVFGKSEYGFQQTTYGPINSFIIIDDDSDMVHLKDRHLKTDGDWGFTNEDANRAIEMLKESTDINSYIKTPME